MSATRDSPGAAWSSMPRDMFAAATADRRDAYFAVLACFDAAALVEPTLNLEQLTQRVASTHPELADPDDLVGLLGQLTSWGHLESAQDEQATYRDVTDFRRRSLQWFLTEAGQALLKGLAAAAAQLEATAGLQVAAIEQVARALAGVAEQAASEHPDASRAHLLLTEAQTHHESIVANLRTFTGQVQTLLGRADVDDEDMAEARSAILSYLRRYVLDAEVPAQRVTAALDRIAGIGVETVIDLVVEGANLAPTFDGRDPAVRATADRRRVLDALADWYRPDDGSEPAFEQLKRRGRDEILRFMRILELRREQRRRAASLPDDFRALARAFSRAPDDDAAHRLWTAAFGLHSARHHHLELPDGPAPSAATPAADNPSAPLVVQLQRRPSPAGRTGIKQPVRDVAGARSRAAAEQAHELAELARRRRGLVSEHPTHLSHFAHLSRDEFDELLEVLREALNAQVRSDGVRHSITPDGQLEVELHPPGDPTEVATLHTDDGQLHLPDFRVKVLLLGVDVLANTTPLQEATG